MSDKAESTVIQLKKISDDEIHGPMDMGELLELSRSAFVAPEDQVSINDGEWVPATEIPELEMEWIVRTEDGIEYGPTSSGTIREFLMVGEISEETLVVHKDTREEQTVGELLGDSTLVEVRREQQQAEEETEEEDSKEFKDSMETARDIKIRQLASDLEEMESKYNSLMLKYRKATEELTRLKQG